MRYVRRWVFKGDGIVISGNFDSKEREIELVYRWLVEEMGYRPGEVEVVEHVGDRSDADVDASVYTADADGQERLVGTFSVEVKEEAAWRWTRYGELGLDFVSAFRWNASAGSPDDASSKAAWLSRGVHRGLDDVRTFAAVADIDKHGKVFYSDADIWLFACDCDRQGDVIEFFAYLGDDIVNDGFRKWLQTDCAFTINDKPQEQGSYSDTWGSAVFFVRPDAMRSIELDGRDKLEEAFTW